MHMVLHIYNIVCVCFCVFVCLCVYTRTHIYVYKHVYIHIHTHTHTHTYTHTHTHTLKVSSAVAALLEGLVSRGEGVGLTSAAVDAVMTEVRVMV